MKLSVMTLPLLPMPEIPGLKRDETMESRPSLREIYAEIRDAGIEFLDISSIDFQFGGEAAVLNALRETGLRCSCYLAFIAAPQTSLSGNEEAVRQGMAAVDQTIRLGADVMMFVPAGYQEAVAVMSRDELAKSFASVLRPVVEYASGRGITVGIEDAPHREFPMCSEAELRYLLEAVPGLKLVFDTGNMVFAGEEPVGYYKHLAPYMVHGHLKDVEKAKDGSIAECAHGTGIVDFAGLFSQFAAHAFSGFLTIELAPDFQTKSSVTERVSGAANYFLKLMNKEETA